MRGFHNSAFDPQTLVLLETAFDEAWLTLDPVRLQDGALEGLLPAAAWPEAS